jgi:hypothetical protein
MSGFSTTGTDFLTRTSLWSSNVKEVFLDELFAMKYVDIITDFPDGTTLNIPSIGQIEVQDYVENNAIKYNAMDTGNFQFTIDRYKSSATYITEQMKQDSFYFSKLISSFVPKEHRALAKAMEVDIFAKMDAGQTASNLNTINGANHRFSASGSNGVIALSDFAKAKYALQKANVPMTNLVAIVDPSMEYTLSTLTQLVGVNNNPRWEGIVRDGMSTGMKYLTNVYGFDVYVSQNLPTGAETINSVAINSSGVSNFFFSAAPDVLPVVGAIRQAPKVDSDYNKDLQREEYVTTARWGFKLFRPENLVTIRTATDQVV